MQSSNAAAANGGRNKLPRAQKRRAQSSSQNQNQRRPLPNQSRGYLQKAGDAAFGPNFKGSMADKAVGAAGSYVASVIDPVGASPAQVPDFNGHSTNASKIVDYKVMADAIGANGGTYAVIVPSLSGGYYFAPVLDATGATVTGLGAASSSDSLTPLASGGLYEYRIVSANVTVDYIGSSTADSGRICINTYTGTSPPTTVTLTDLFNDEGVSCPAKYGASINLKPFQTPLMVPTSSSNSPYFPLVVVAGIGLPVGVKSLGVKITFNIEAIFNGESLMRQSAMHSICDMDQCCHAANITGRTVTYAVGPNAYDKLVRAGWELAKRVAGHKAAGTITSLLLT